MTAPLQRVREALVAVLDAAPGIVAITGRPNANIVAWADLSLESDLPILAYQVVSLVQITGSGDQRRARIQLTAAARDDEAIAQELLNAASIALTTPALAALAAPLDACRIQSDEQVLAGDFELAEQVARADMDVVLDITF